MITVRFCGFLFWVFRGFVFFFCGSVFFFLKIGEKNTNFCLIWVFLIIFFGGFVEVMLDFREGSNVKRVLVGIWSFLV